MAARHSMGALFKCWVVAEHRTHGVVDIEKCKAIYRGCDVFFYTLAEDWVSIASQNGRRRSPGQKTGMGCRRE